MPLVYDQTTDQAVVTQLKLLKQNNLLQRDLIKATQNPAAAQYENDIPFKDWLQYANSRAAEVLAYHVEQANYDKKIADLSILNQAKTRNKIFNDYYFRPMA